MHFALSLIPVVASFGAALSQPRHMPSCLADCLKNTTNPCTQSSLGALVACLNNECVDAASGITLMLTPKAEYSCQQSLVPGAKESPSLMTIVGDASCITSPFDFKSFIPSTGPATHMDVLGQNCRLDLFPDRDCLGDSVRLNLSIFRANKCAFYSGRSVSMSCGSEISDPTFNPYAYLEHMCANSTATNSAGSSPSYSSSPAANSTVHRPSIGSYKTATASMTSTTYHPTTPDHVETSASPDSAASNEQTMKPSVAGLVAVVAAAILML